ncbi:MAG: hypothetical protein AB8G77_11335 [Rhodothermales bacterium]
MSKPLFSATRVFFDYLYVSVYQPDMDNLNGEDSKGMSNIEIAQKPFNIGHSLIGVRYSRLCPKGQSRAKYNRS